MGALLAPAALIQSLPTTSDEPAIDLLIKQRDPSRDVELGDSLKARADECLRTSLENAAVYITALERLAAITGNDAFAALGMLAHANVLSIGRGEYEAAIDVYDRAAEIYGRLGLPIERAQSQIGKIHALANLGRYDEADDVGRAAARQFSAAGETRREAAALLNLATVHARRGDDRKSLQVFDEAAEAYQQVEDPTVLGWYYTQINRAYVLRNLGRFEESIDSANLAYEKLADLGQTASAARAEQMAALTLLAMGHYTEALVKLQQVRMVYQEDGRSRDAALVDLYLSDVYLQLRQFDKVIDSSSRIRNLFLELGADQIAGLALVNQAVAQAGLHQFLEAFDSLQAAREIFEKLDNALLGDLLELEQAAILLHQGKNEAAATLTSRISARFGDLGLPVQQGKALVLEAAAWLALGELAQARQVAQHAASISASGEIIPAVSYQAHHLLGKVLLEEGKPADALEPFQLAMSILDSLHSNLIVELRSDFLLDKNELYQDSVKAALESERSELALESAERSRSRSLHELLSGRVRVNLHSGTASDRVVIESLEALTDRRDNLARRLATDIDGSADPWPASSEERRQKIRELQLLESEITEAWHQLLLNNRSYRTTAATQALPPLLDPGRLDRNTLVLEYFFAGEELILFVIGQAGIEPIVLPTNRREIRHLTHQLLLNFRSAPMAPGAHSAGLVANANRLLQLLYEKLLRPVEKDLTDVSSLSLIPHNVLHYLPLHALNNGNRYVIERWSVRYLPAYTLAGQLEPVLPKSSLRSLVFGHSSSGKLPYAILEAQSVAEKLRASPRLNADATKHRLLTESSGADVLHVAAHGTFRGDNPLFSGIALDDGMFATIDSFQLSLPGALVVLSACDTGRAVVGGGDELLGLMRGIFHAGAGCMLLSKWTIDDQSGLEIMRAFYDAWLGGLDPPAALRQAQVSAIEGRLAIETPMSHPCYWAPLTAIAGPRLANSATDLTDHGQRRETSK